MDKEQNIVYVQSQLIACQVEMQAMIAENKSREQKGDSIAYGEDAFMRLFDKYAISHNDVITQLCE